MHYTVRQYSRIFPIISPFPFVYSSSILGNVMLLDKRTSAVGPFLLACFTTKIKFEIQCLSSANFIKPAYELTCGPHQVYNSCRLCESTCSSATPVCRTSCVAGCFCEPGYLKSPSGECVLLKNCPRGKTGE